METLTLDETPMSKNSGESKYMPRQGTKMLNGIGNCEMTAIPMEIDTTYPIPTGYLFTGNYSKGKLETLSIGDYGKAHNVKADFLGYTNELEGVPNTYCMPLSEKWVVTVSTQYGCPKWRGIL